MIPTFPNFKKLESIDRKELESFTKGFPPYSDFNFSSMWSWDINETMQLSILNDNLVVFFNDYLSDKHYLSFIGKNELHETGLKLMEFPIENAESGILKYVPEEVATVFLNSKFLVSLDEDNCDHIITVDASVNLDECIQCFRQNCNQFIRNYITTIQIRFDSFYDTDKLVLIDLFIKWANKKNLNYLELVEFKAFERYLQITEADIRLLSIYDGNKLIGFQIFEFLSQEYVTCEFFKADTDYKGIYQFMEWETCKYLNELGVNFMNLQVDLGISGLRKSKTKANTKFLLNSFIIQLENERFN